MEEKAVKICYKEVKVKSSQKIFTLKIINNFIITLKYLLIMDYQQYTSIKPKSWNYKDTPAINYRNRFE